MPGRCLAGADFQGGFEETDRFEFNTKNDQVRLAVPKLVQEILDGIEDVHFNRLTAHDVRTRTGDVRTAVVVVRDDHALTRVEWIFAAEAVGVDDKGRLLDTPLRASKMTTSPLSSASTSITVGVQS